MTKLGGRSLPLVTVLAVGVVLWLAMAPRWTRQPLAFNHRLHVEEVGLDCADCHVGAETTMRATIPNIEFCRDCHEEAQTDSPEEAKLVDYIASGEKIPWFKVYHVAEHVFFSHRRHTSIGGIGCEVCHGAVAERIEPVTRQYWSPTMDACMECHEDSGVSNDCIFCHY